MGAAVALLIEDNDAYRAATAACLRLAGCTVEAVDDPGGALDLLGRRPADLVVWGRGVQPADDRLPVLAAMRAATSAGLVVLDPNHDHARSDLETGADYWLPKPYVPGALVGTARAALRRARPPAAGSNPRTVVRGMTLDGAARTLGVDGRIAAFTAQEWDLLMILINHPNRFLDANAILKLGWRGGDHAGEEIRTYVGRVRRKLGGLNLPFRLVTHHGLGYRLEFDESGEPATAS